MDIEGWFNDSSVLGVVFPRLTGTRFKLYRSSAYLTLGPSSQCKTRPRLAAYLCSQNCGNFCPVASNLYSLAPFVMFYKALGTVAATESMPACNLFPLCSEHNIVHMIFTVGCHQQLFFFIHQLTY